MPNLLHRSFMLMLLLLVACSSNTSDEFELPELGIDGKLDDSTPEIVLERQGANGRGGDWSGSIPAERAAAVTIVQFVSTESIARFEVESTSGVPHLYVRRVSDGSVALEAHGETSTVSGSFGVTADTGGTYQIAIFVTKSGGGEITIRVAQDSACRDDSDAAEPNEEAESAAAAVLGLHRGTVCNGADSFDRDYFKLTIAEPNRVLRVANEHVPEFGPLQVVVSGPFGPVELTRSESPGNSLGGEEITVAIDEATEAAPEGSDYVIGVWGDELYNVYGLIVCNDDQFAAGAGNGSAERAASIELGTTISRGTFCPVLGGNFNAKLPDDADYYSVSVPANTAVRIVVTSDEFIGFDGPADALFVDSDTWELTAAPTDRDIVFGLDADTGSHSSDYRLVVEAI